MRPLAPIARQTARGRLVISLGLATGLTLAAGGIAIETLAASAPGKPTDAAQERMHSTRLMPMVLPSERAGRPLDPVAPTPPFAALPELPFAVAPLPMPNPNTPHPGVPQPVGYGKPRTMRGFIEPQRNVPRLAGDVAGPMQD